MLKYDQQLAEVKSRLASVKRILIVLPQNLNTDNLAAGLSLYLSLKSAAKTVDIVSTGTPLVSHTNLFGIGEVKNHAAKAGAGNFIISLDGVVDNTGTMQQVPALEKLDWFPEGSKLNLVFHVVPGQRFEPTNITSRHEESGYDLTFVIGTQNLNELGELFTANSQYFTQSQVVNIDNNSANSQFGFANIIDPQASSLSEIVAQILPSLTINMDRDTASNIISGIYSSTNNLTQKINPDTFMVISQAVQVGGTLPNTSQVQDQPVQSVPVQQPEPVQPIAQPAPAPQFDMNPQPQTVQPEPQYSAPVETPAPAQNLAGSPFIVPPQDINIPMPTYQPDPVQQAPQPGPQFQFNQPQNPVQSQQAPAIPQANAQGFDLRQIFQNPGMAASAVPANNQTVSPEPIPTVEQIYQPTGGGHEYEPAPQAPQPEAPQPSSEERPMGEVATSPNPEIESTPTPDWLVPKIFKGGNLG